MATELSKIKISEKRIEIYHSMGVYSIEDLVRFYPVRYEMMVPTFDNEKVIIEATIIEEPKIFFIRKNLTRMYFTVEYDNKHYPVTIFNRQFLKSKLIVGQNITIIGKRKGSNIVASDIKLEALSTIQGIYPIYSLKKGITSKVISSDIQKALNYLMPHLIDFIPYEYIQQHQLILLKDALTTIHFPTSKHELKQAIKYLKYEEFFKFQLTLLYMKKYHHQDNVGISKNFDNELIQKYKDSLPFALTVDQIKASYEILEDLSHPIMMDRLVQGDVGSGKTVVASIAIYANFLAGYQSALMAPTEILANQHYRTLCKLLEHTGMKIGLLKGGLSASQKRQVQEDIAANQIDLVVGTHALIQEHVHFFKLGLVITDEQHRFGVNQRKRLFEKGRHVDILTMSATPIPRTLAMILHGDKDVSTIKTKPSNRLETITKVVLTNSMKPILKSFEDYLEQGGQCYVVCPLVEKSDALSNVTNVIDVYHAMEKHYQDRFRIGLLHGKMDEEQKNSVMQQFLEHKIDIIVCTTVIEVGVDVENANMIVIYDAQRFGLSQLHQLRGRVGRSLKQGYCYLLDSSGNHQASQRLAFLENHSDGFEISEYDLQIRGPGDILGQKQSGIPNFLIADIMKDFNILMIAKNDALALMSHIEDSKYYHIKKMLENKIETDDTYLD